MIRYLDDEDGLETLQNLNRKLTLVADTMHGLDNKELDLMQHISGQSGCNPGCHEKPPGPGYSPEDCERLNAFLARGLITKNECTDGLHWHPHVTALGLEVMSLQKTVNG